MSGQSNDVASAEDNANEVITDEEITPPEYPPEVTLSQKEQTNRSSRELQQGIPVYHYWRINGEIESYKQRKPIQWPDQIETRRSEGKLIIDLATGVMPHNLLLLSYKGVGPDGILAEESGERIECESISATDNSCGLQIEKKEGEATWQIMLPADQWESDQYFLLITVAWLAPSNVADVNRLTTYNATWSFYVNVT